MPQESIHCLPARTASDSARSRPQRRKLAAKSDDRCATLGQAELPGINARSPLVHRRRFRGCTGCNAEEYSPLLAPFVTGGGQVLALYVEELVMVDRRFARPPSSPFHDPSTDLWPHRSPTAWSLSCGLPCSGRSGQCLTSMAMHARTRRDVSRGLRSDCCGPRNGLAMQRSA